MQKASEARADLLPSQSLPGFTEIKTISVCSFLLQVGSYNLTPDVCMTRHGCQGKTRNAVDAGGSHGLRYFHL